VPAGAERYLALRAVGGQGQVGPIAEFDSRGAVAGGPAANNGCVALAPISGIKSVQVFPHELRVRGKVYDNSCGTARVRRIRIEISRGSFKLWANAVLRSAAPGDAAYFTLTIRRTLASGTYLVTSYASDAAGRTEIPLRWDTTLTRVH